MLKTFANGPDDDGNSLIVDWHANDFMAVLLATILTWPVWTILAHVVIFLLLLFPEMLPPAANEDYDLISLPRSIWYKVLSFVVQIGLNWVLTWYGF